MSPRAVPAFGARRDGEFPSNAVRTSAPAVALDAARRSAAHLVLALAIVLAAGFASTARSQGQTQTPTYYGTYTLNGGTAVQTGQTYSASAADTSGVWVTNSGVLALTNCIIATTGSTSSQDSSSFYGLNAGVLAALGTITMTGGSVTTSGAGANGVFAYGSGSSVTLSGVTIKASADGGHGVMASGGGSLTVTDADITTAGGSAAAIATDRGGGTIVVTGGTMTTSGANSPGIYSTGDIAVTGATISSTGAESAVIEGTNSITLTNVAMVSSMANKWGVMIYQSMSGDASGTQGVFTMTGGSLANTATTGPLFFVTNSTGVITLKGVTARAGSGTLVEAGGTTQWGTSGSNGGTVNLTADGESLTGNLVTDDTISSIAATLKNTTTLTGSANSAALTIDSTSVWNVTAASKVTNLTTSGTISGTGPITSAVTTLQAGTIGAILAGTGGLTKTTSGTATLSGANTYTGATTVSAGTLSLTGSLAGSAVTVNSGATLGGTGTISGALSVASGSSLVLDPSGHIAVGGNAFFGGTVTVVPSTSIAAGTYTLLGYGGALTGAPAFVWGGPSGQTATFSASTSGKITVTIGTTGLTITSASPLADGTVGASYSQTLAASGGTTPYTWSVSSGTMPTGLSLSNAGTVSGTPTAAGSFDFVVQVADSGGLTATRSFAIDIVATALFPAVASQAGQNGTQWRAELELFNPDGIPRQATLQIVERGSDTVVAQGTHALAAGQTLRIADVYADLGAPSGAGMLRVTGPVLSWARSYNQRSDGTAGQDLPRIVPSDGFASGQAIYFPVSTPADITTDFRSNFAAVNLGNTDITCVLSSGDATQTLAVPAGAYVQINDVGTSLGLASGASVVQVTGTGAWAGFVSTIDPVLGDPSTMEGLIPSGSIVRLFPAIASLPGTNGTEWRAEAVLANVTAADTTVLLELLPRDGSSVAATANVPLAAGQVFDIPDVYACLQAASGAGMLRVTGEALTWVKSYDQGTTATFGQDVPPVAPGAGYAAGVAIDFPISAPADIETDFRSNLAVVNLETSPITVTVASGTSSRTQDVSAGSYVQINDIGMWLGLSAGYTTVTVTGTGRWAGTVSTIDPGLGDPTTVIGLPDGD